MKMTLPLSGLIWMGCIDGTKLPNNDVVDSSVFVDMITEEDHAETTVLFSVDTTVGQISQINPLDGTTTSIQSVSMNHQISSMTFNTSGVAYIYDHLSRKIGVLDHCSGDITLLPETNEDLVICGISFASDDSLYGLDSKDNQLVRYDLETGEATSIGELNMNIRSCGLAYDSTTERLIGATASTGEVFNIDIDTGKTFNHLATDVPFESVGVAYASQTDSLLVSTGSSLYSVDLTDGSSILLGNMEGHIDDLVFHSQCP